MEDNTPQSPPEVSPVHRSNWPASIVFPTEYTGGERLSLSWDLGGRVSDTEKKKLIREWVATLPEMQQLRWLNLWSQVNQPLFEAACQIRQLENLVIKWSNIKSLVAIAALGNLKSLYIGSSTRIESIEPLTALHALRELHIENFKRISDFAPLERLTGLETLTITGSMWSNQKVDSLEPLARMTWLKHLAIDTSKLQSARSLAALAQLESLNMGGGLPMEEYAFLAARMPHTHCRWFQPYLDLGNSGIGHCKTCGQESRVMLTGRNKGVICRHCDAARLARHEAAFQACKEAALAG